MCDKFVTSYVVFVYFVACENAECFSEGNSFREQTASRGGRRGLQERIN